MGTSVHITPGSLFGGGDIIWIGGNRLRQCLSFSFNGLFVNKRRAKAGKPRHATQDLHGNVPRPSIAQKAAVSFQGSQIDIQCHGVVVVTAGAQRLNALFHGGKARHGISTGTGVLYLDSCFLHSKAIDQWIGHGISFAGRIGLPAHRVWPFVIVVAVRSLRGSWNECSVATWQDNGTRHEQVQAMKPRDTHCRHLLCFVSNGE
mmetsp:Transcript_14346/g.39893  ORF Transcript_14346/g.39893 Transcript_14346/m.39893 type:complete len:204 (-) Transcript_14346:18-629(-)